jgi:hypothetical protein
MASGRYSPSSAGGGGGGGGEALGSAPRRPFKELEAYGFLRYLAVVTEYCTRKLTVSDGPYAGSHVPKDILIR